MTKDIASSSKEGKGKSWVVIRGSWLVARDSCHGLGTCLALRCQNGKRPPLAFERVVPEECEPSAVNVGGP
ncbi:hypothetical protein ACFL34_04145, partial [Candidatus Sumerlaeota bacterium]